MGPAMAQMVSQQPVITDSQGQSRVGFVLDKLAPEQVYL